MGLFIYLFFKRVNKSSYLSMSLLILEREGERERERERNTEVREKHGTVASHTHPDWGLNPQPKYVL